MKLGSALALIFATSNVLGLEGDLLRTFAGATGISRAMFHASPYLFVGSSDKIVRQYTTSNATLISTYTAAAQIRAIVVVGSTMYTTGDDSSVLKWNVANGTFTVPAGNFTAHSSAIYGLAATASNIYSGSNDMTVKQWSTAGAVTYTWSIGLAINNIAVYGDYLFVVPAGTSGNAPRMYSLLTLSQTPVRSFTGVASSSIYGLFIEPTGALLYVGNCAQKTYQFNISSGALVNTYSGCRNATSNCVRGIDIAGNYMYTSSDDGQIVKNDLTTGSCSRFSLTTSGGVNKALYMVNAVPGEGVYSTSTTGQALLWEFPYANIWSQDFSTVALGTWADSFLTDATEQYMQVTANAGNPSSHNGLRVEFNTARSTNAFDDITSSVVPFTPFDEGSLSFDVVFEGGFDFQSGKLPGMCASGSKCWSSTAAVPGDSWSVRAQFTEHVTDPSRARLSLIVHHNMRESTSGDTYNTAFFFSRNTWYNVKIHVKLNTISPVALNDGELSVFVDGVKKMHLNTFRFINESATTTASKIAKAAISFGHNSTPNNTGYARFDNFAFVQEQLTSNAGNVLPQGSSLYVEDFEAETVGATYSNQYLIISSSGKTGKGVRATYKNGSLANLYHANYFFPSTVQTSAISHIDTFVENNFQFVKGGKLPGGLCGGTCTTGCKSADPSGWSMRAMWRQQGNLQLYSYSNDRESDCGDAFLGNFRLPIGTWTAVDILVILNNPSTASNGEIKLFINGQEHLHVTGIQIRAGTVGIEKQIFGTFHGGSTYDWAPSADVYARYDNINSYNTV